MSDRHAHPVTSTQVVDVFDVDCRAPKSRRGDEEYVRTTQVVVPRRGVFGVTLSKRRVIAEPTSALVFHEDTTYTVDHPSPHGDRCAVFIFRPELLEEALGGQPRDYGSINPMTQLTTALLASPRRDLDDLEFEEAALSVLGMLVDDFSGSSREVTRGPVQRQRVAQVRGLLASSPQERWTLDSVAKEMHVSAFHLAHQFRAITGTTIGQYILRLRLAIVLEQMVEGRQSLGALAAEAGFAHHSHLTERFRSVFGITPSASRSLLTARRVTDMRRVIDEQALKGPNDV
ncbi:MAG: helix-turn-helix transcriptional regulator [Actinomycetota bacterium]|nr:helix-turn-helix transcriptional regulator [Actinomycetota bacterium]